MRGRVSLYVDETDRIVIVGMPASGKMPLARELSALYGLPILHTDEIEGADWSETSEVASEGFDGDSGFIACGMAIPRALRKWIRRNEHAARPYSIAIGMWEPRGELTDAQLRMGRAAEDVWRQVQAHFVSVRGGGGADEDVAEMMEAAR